MVSLFDWPADGWLYYWPVVTQDQFLSVQIVLDAPGDHVAGLVNCQVMRERTAAVNV